MSEKQSIITIDGPAGVGKSTVSRRVAAATGYTYLDTGAMYRGVGLFLQQEKVNLEDSEEIAKKLSQLDLELLPAQTETGDVGVKLNGVDVSRSIRTPEMAMVASKVSALFEVREFLTRMQREYGIRGRVVAEGRDTGTVVFPLASHKFFLDAEPAERSRRRCAQLQAKGQDADYETILSMTLERDKNDREREIAPLRQAADGVYIDTTQISIEEVVGKILKVVQG